MRRVEDNGRRTIRAIQLFRSDLQHLIGLAGEGQVEIEHGGMIYESVDELAQHVKREPLRKLEITVRKEGFQYLSIWIWGERVILEMPNRDNAEFFAVFDFLVQHVRPLAIPPTGAWSLVVNWVGMLAWLALTGWAIHLLIPDPWWGLVWIIAIAIGGALSILNPLHVGHSRVFLHDLHERSPFWHRNRDVVIGLVGALVGAVLTAVLGRLLG
jgi:hypothetical protein